MPMMYSPQFRERAVALIIDEGRPVAEVARDSEVTEATTGRTENTCAAPDRSPPSNTGKRMADAAIL